MLKITHLSTEDISGGAARAAARLHAGLLRIGHDSRMVVAHRSSDDPAVSTLTRAASPYKSMVRAIERSRIQRGFLPYVKSRPAGSDMFSDDRSDYAADLPDGISPSDVMNLHWVAGFVDYARFFAIYGKSVPVIWTLHDMNVFTGGCHYDEGCGKFTAACGACPQLGSTDQNDLSRKIWSRKTKTFERLDATDLSIVADSKWLASEASRSSLLRKFPITSIPYGLDTETFSPRNRPDVRGALGIPLDASVIMFAAEVMTIKRKGLPTLVDALRAMAATANLLLLSVGRRMPDLPASIPHRYFGHVNSDVFLSLLYSAADVFVIPSIQEAFGQTALEAMACGTPVIGSAVGGIPEIVADNVTGYLVPPSSPEALRHAIVKLLSDPEKRAEMSANCRRVVLEGHTLEAQARSYEGVYRKMVRTDQKSGRNSGHA